MSGLQKDLECMRQIQSIFYRKSLLLSSLKHFILVPLSAVDVFFREMSYSNTTSLRSCSFRCIWRYANVHFSKGPSPPLPPSVCPIHFRVWGLIRLVRKAMESHLSCQIQLCAPLASKRRDIFPFSSLKQAFFFVLQPIFPFRCTLSSCLHQSLLHPATIHHPPPLSFFLFFLPVGVVEGHSAHWLTFRESGGIAEEGEGQPGGPAVHRTVHSSLFASDMIGEVWKDTWGLETVQEC